MALQEELVRVPDFIRRPRHRLFGVFDDPAAGDRAVAMLRAEGHTGADDIWVLSGEEGIRRLDATGSVEGLRVRIIRLFELILNSDVEYMDTLQSALRGGAKVVAVSVAPDQADETAHRLRGHGGRSFAYFLNWEFQPVRT